MQATVYKSTGSWYIVKNDEGQVYNARIKGKFKIDGITSTNPIAVGDIVEIENEDDLESTVITEIYERRNYINRVSPHNKNQHHIVAANLDQSLLFATLKDPKTSLGFIDRFLVISEAYGVPAIIVFNKCDLFGKKENEKLKKDIDLSSYKIVQEEFKNFAEVPDLPFNNENLIKEIQDSNKTADSIVKKPEYEGFLKQLTNGSFDKELAKEQINNYRENSKAFPLIETVTFHPSYSYQDFVEGIGVETVNEQIIYKPKDGIFKKKSLLQLLYGIGIDMV